MSLMAFIWSTNDDRQIVRSTQSVIVQAGSLDEAAAAVDTVGGSITHRLGIIDGVAADLSLAQYRSLQNRPALRVTSGGRVTLSSQGNGNGGGGNGGGGNGGGGGGQEIQPSHYPALIHADQLHTAGITGSTVTIAVLDTGLEGHWAIEKDTSGSTRLLAK